ncbi:LysR family transcriptional regulator [Ramlibacter sp. PS3R-8]|uniref:LysR family transcriptional regulator n=1 Tax=Ramlibacter sp. PS3R-8 TaxID=3133437 RepID=UPI0030A7D3E4
MDLHLRDLRFFETVAELGHMGRAAKEVGRSQPALTKCIQRLEEVMGSPLFERAGRGIRLTPVGEVLHARCRLLRAASDEVVREVRDFAQGSAGHVTLGSGPIAAEHLIPELCRAILAHAPRVKVDVVVGPSWELRSQLRQGKLDLLVGLAVDSDPELVSHALVEDVVVVAASAKHPVFRRRNVDMATLLEYGWALPSAHIPSRQWLDLAFSARGLPEPDVKLESGSIALLPRMVERTDLLTFVSRHTLALERSAALREVKLPATTLRRNLGVTHRRTGYLSPAAEGVLKLLRKQGKAFFSRTAP